MQPTQRRLLASQDLSGRDLDALVITSPANVRYLSGFTGSNGVLLLSRGEAELYTDPRYREQAALETGVRVKVVRRGPLYRALLRDAGRRRLRRLGFEAGRLTYSAYEMLRDRLPLEVSLEPVADLIEQRRLVKDTAEIALLREAAALNSRAFERAVRRVRPGVSERDVAAELDYQARRLGSDGPAFETIVAAGARSALPHGRPGANVLAGNQLVLIDTGALRAGYASDMTRMLYLGGPTTRVRRLYRAVLDAQAAAIATVRDGVAAGSVDRAARRVLKAHGLDGKFVHSTGHGLGLEIHEAPRLGRKEKTRLRTGMVVTIEPGAYLEGFGGVRIEDMVLVTATGCEVLTVTPRELLAV